MLKHQLVDLVHMCLRIGSCTAGKHCPAFPSPSWLQSSAVNALSYQLLGLVSSKIMLPMTCSIITAIPIGHNTMMTASCNLAEGLLCCRPLLG